MNQIVIMTALRKMGYEPDLVRDGGSLVDAATASDYHIVFTDIRMPEHDGLAAFERVCAEREGRSMPVFVAPADVLEVADRYDATPFDVEGVHWSHRGEKCTFDVMLEAFKLTTEPLLRVAAIVRGADTNRHDLAPEAAGLLAVSLGLSRMHKDDLAQLDAGMVIYDALYRWARDATDEGHDWPSTSVPSG